jgi:hypothetical protein
VVKHKWNNNGWEVDHNINDKIQINIKDEQGHPRPIIQLPPSKGELALEIMFSPIGNTNDQVAYLKQKSSTSETQRRGFVYNQQ